MFLSAFASTASILAVLVLVAELYMGSPGAWWFYVGVFLGAVLFNYEAELLAKEALLDEE